ncbi:putative DUF1983 domain-containing protein [Pseudomonas sp. IT-P12]|uniref:hypothetical protein n=1 Tax=Pseudomonas sp. IT-P12 TaxID=3026450 RepID=UPI0039E14B54
MARLPANALPVSHDHCVMGSAPELDGVVHTLWEKNWEVPANRPVTTKYYTLSGNTVTEVKLILSPERELITKEVFSIQDMLISIAHGQHVIADGTTHFVRNKIFKKEGDKWSCALRVKGWPDFDLITEIVDQDTMIHTSRYHDVHWGEDDEGSLFINKKFKEVGPNKYEVSVSTTAGGTTTYTTTRDIDWNTVFLTAQHGDSILVDKRIWTVSHKICNVTRSNEIYVTPYLEVN